MSASRPHLAIEIDPEPTPEERVAILEALATANAGVRARDPGDWWRSGLPATIPYTGRENGWSSSQGRKPWRR